MAYNDGVAGQGPIDTQTVTIAISTTTSTKIDLGSHKFMSLLMPSVMTGSAMTFTASVDDSTYTAVFDDSGNAVQITIPTAASLWVSLQPSVMAKLSAFRYIKLVSGSTELAARTISVALK